MVARTPYISVWKNHRKCLKSSKEKCWNLRRNEETENMKIAENVISVCVQSKKRTMHEKIVRTTAKQQQKQPKKLDLNCLNEKYQHFLMVKASLCLRHQQLTTQIKYMVYVYARRSSAWNQTRLILISIFSSCCDTSAPKLMDGEILEHIFIHSKAALSQFRLEIDLCARVRVYAFLMPIQSNFNQPANFSFIYARFEVKWNGAVKMIDSFEWISFHTCLK